MAETYRIQTGGLMKNASLTPIKYYSRKLFSIFRYVFLYTSSFLLTFRITFYVFQNCVNAKATQDSIIIAMSDCISLGSIFATFGSAVIAVMSLTSAQQISSFEEKTDVLNREFAKQGITSWKRWEFLPRYSRHLLPRGTREYLVLENIKICFLIDQKEIVIPIPTVKKDFSDLPVLHFTFCLFWLKRKYQRYVQKRGSIDDLLIWSCVFSMYKNIVFYRVSQFAVWLGTAFVLDSIIFAFFYSQLYRII